MRDGMLLSLHHIYALRSSDPASLLDCILFELDRHRVSLQVRNCESQRFEKSASVLDNLSGVAQCCSC